MKARIQPLGAPVADLRASDKFTELRELAKSHGLALFVSNVDQRAGLAYVNLKSGDLVVGSFHSLSAAIQWLGGADD